MIQLFLFKKVLRGPLRETIGYGKEVVLGTDPINKQDLKLFGEIKMSQKTRDLVYALSLLKEDFLERLEEIINKAVEIS